VEALKNQNRKSSIAKMILGRKLTQTKRSRFSTTRFGQELDDSQREVLPQFQSGGVEQGSEGDPGHSSKLEAAAPDVE